MINKEIEAINFERFIQSANLTNFKNKCEFWDINGSSQKLAKLSESEVKDLNDYFCSNVNDFLQ